MKSADVLAGFLQMCGKFLRNLWWSFLSIVLHMFTSCAFDPSVDSAFGKFPPADTIDSWARDPPDVSSLPYCG